MTHPAENMDAAEVQKFERIASQWWDTQGEFKPLHLMNPVRTNFINQQLNTLRGKQVLDIACGGGLLCEAMAQHGALVTGVDMGEASIQVAKLHQVASKLEINYHISSAEQFCKLHPEKFDAVTCLELLEHVPEPRSTIAACAKMTKPGGDIFFSTINRNFKAFLITIVAAEYLTGMIQKGTHHYDQFIRPSELSSWCRQSGLELIRMSGMRFNPMRVQFELSEQLDVNFIAHFKKQ